MELENILITISSGVSLFMVLTSPVRDLWASIFLISGFSGLFVVRLGHFMLMQYSRLTERLHKLSSWLTALFVLVIPLGFIFGRFLSTGTVLNFLFDYYLVLAALYATMLITSQLVIFKPFDPDFNIGTRKEEKRAQI